MRRLRQKDEFFCLVPSPPRRNRDSIFLVDRMPEFAGIKTFLTPLLTTYRLRGQ